MKQPNLSFTSDDESTNATGSWPLTPNPKPHNPEVLLFTDGACSGNPGPGGWAFILRHVPSGKETESSGSIGETTNNRMELQAIIEGLKKLKRRSAVRVVTDSSYVKNGITQWIHGWKARGWMRKTSSGLKPVKNVDLWKELDQLINYHSATFEHIRGHAGHPENERCDELAVAAYRELIDGS
jgi:ribonuclease HI